MNYRFPLPSTGLEFNADNFPADFVQWATGPYLLPNQYIFPDDSTGTYSLDLEVLYNAFLASHPDAIPVGTPVTTTDPGITTGPLPPTIAPTTSDIGMYALIAVGLYFAYTLLK